MALPKPHPTRETYRLATLERTPPEAVPLAALVAAMYILLYLSPLRGGKVLPSSRLTLFTQSLAERVWKLLSNRNLHSFTSPRVLSLQQKQALDRVQHKRTAMDAC